MVVPAASDGVEVGDVGGPVGPFDDVVEVGAAARAGPVGVGHGGVAGPDGLAQPVGRDAGWPGRRRRSGRSRPGRCRAGRRRVGRPAAAGWRRRPSSGRRPGCGAASQASGWRPTARRGRWWPAPSVEGDSTVARLRRRRAWMWPGRVRTGRRVGRPSGPVFAGVVPALVVERVEQVVDVVGVEAVEPVGCRGRWGEGGVEGFGDGGEGHRSELAIHRAATEQPWTQRHELGLVGGTLGVFEP